MTKKSGGLSVGRNCLRPKGGPLNFILGCDTLFFYILSTLRSFPRFLFFSRETAPLKLPPFKTVATQSASCVTEQTLSTGRYDAKSIATFRKVLLLKN